MRAVVYEQYGPPSVLSVADVPTPSPKAGEVLVRVRATSLNSWDWDLVAGNPLVRISAPFRPQHRIIGADIAGVVEAVGEGVARLSVGDAVVGELSDAGWGGLAEYVAVKAEVLVPKPEALSFEQAASVPQAGTLALQALRLRHPVQPGERVLINGGGGGMGTFAVQLAKHVDAEVTAVDRGAKLELMRSLGADHVIDYTREDFAMAGRRYDRIIECVGQRPMAAYRACLAPVGTLALVGGRARTILAVALAGMRAKPDGQQLRLLIWRTNPADYAELLELCATGAITPVIDGVYPLGEAAAAIQRIADGTVLGKVIVTP